MTEKWTYVRSGDREAATVTGRERVSLIKKLNPLWWLGNDGEPTPPAWYLPKRPYWWRFVFWYFRNPLVNFNNCVIGVVDRDYTVTGPYPVMVPDWLGVNIIERIDAHRGFKCSMIWTQLPRPFVSYTGKKRGTRRVLWHIGWQQGGDFAVKFNITRDGP